MPSPKTRWFSHAADALDSRPASARPVAGTPADAGHGAVIPGEQAPRYRDADESWGWELRPFLGQC